MDYRKCVMLFALILYSCTKPVEKKIESFTEKQAQYVSERTVKELMPVDSLNITKEFDGISISRLDLNDTAIFAKLGLKIAKFSKQDLSVGEIYNIPEGRGPGEVINLNVTLFKAGKKNLVIYDGKAKKTVLYDLDGNFREEFLNGAYQANAMAMDGSTFYFQVMPNQEYLFYEVKRAESESIVLRQFQKLTDDGNALAYTGEIIYHGNSLYYGGYSEPLIRRYDLSGEEVHLIFSRAVIDDYNSENNYQKPQQTSGGNRFFGYSSEAKFASQDIAADDTYLYSVRHHNDEEGYKYLDIYDVEEGNYVGSFALKYYPYHIGVDNHHIYTLESYGGVKYLMKYEKPEMNF